LNPVCPDIKGLPNVIYAKDQPEYLPLPAAKTPDGEVITCWQFSWHERIKLLFTGRLFLTLMTFNQPLQPIRMSVDPPEVP